MLFSERREETTVSPLSAEKEEVSGGGGNCGDEKVVHEFAPAPDVPPLLAHFVGDDALLDTA
eukprot:200702-Ditylum_brightwellii.AAC.1